VKHTLSLSINFPVGKIYRFVTMVYINRTMAILDIQVKVTLRPTISLGVRRPIGTRDQFFFLFEIFV
jgi:hypothetical protein